MPVTVGVELLGSAGGGAYNDAAATSTSVGIGATVLFATSPVVNIPGDLDLGGGGMSRGSARILATSKKIACSASGVDPVNVPPASAWELAIITKTKQKAFN
jgi:hypothetical protein